MSEDRNAIMAPTLQATGNPILCKDCFKGRKEKSRTSYMTSSTTNKQTSKFKQQRNLPTTLAENASMDPTPGMPS